MTEQNNRGSRRVYLDFVGCRLNQAEIERMGRQFVARGDVLTDSPADADLVVVNTCAVTNTAARKSRQRIRQVGRTNARAEIVATGCYAELSPEKLASLPGVAHVVGNMQNDHLVALISGEDTGPLYEREPLLREPLPPGTLGRTRAFVKVQDGCDNRCTFCVTTLARGDGRSRAPEEVIEEVNLLVDMGYQEVVLTGVHLGSYGKDRGDGFRLFELVRALLLRTDVPHLRLSSLEPWDLAPGFFDLWAAPRLGAHLHLPLQSGCNATLRRMARRTTQASFAALVEAARARIPDLALTTDIIVGFPGETDEEFEESLRFVQEMDFARLHVFPYSKRPGTAAARMPNQVPPEVVAERKARMLAHSDAQWEAFQARHVGRTYDVLWESARGATPDGFIWSGLTGNYLRVVTTSPADLANTITPARLLKVGDDGVLAEVA
ncbi:MAG: tRNA (N(6)-L-threonylcarbamoyladenosine(37)-C(2))-methylthiotransferase MtaB [Chloroflexi bacterium]|nr:tRNA (N(6)-L-threonylcarbamoyladenosine(37)-C(2))-methylthiotransferase MtaB [Chloroflexota bacterium]